MHWRRLRRALRFDWRAFLNRTDRSLLVIAVVLTVTAALLIVAWRARETIPGLEIRMTSPAEGDGLRVTWFGVSTLLFDDGETQILVDGYISRPTVADVVLDRPVTNDAATINYWLHEYGVWRLAAIIPSHTHFDHAMDIGAIANRSSASIIGSESAAAIGRGAGVPEDQIIVTEADAEYRFGRFTVRLIETPHAPIGWRGGVPFDGTIDEPLAVPAPLSAWRAGRSHSILVSHPEHTTLVQASAGFSNRAMQSLRADTVFLGMGLLGRLGPDYLRDYWVATVTTTGARRVVPVHFDDYTQPFGEIELPPLAVDDVPGLFERLNELRDTSDKDTEIVPEYDHEYFVFGGSVQYKFVPSSLLRLTVEKSSRRYSERPSFDLNGNQLVTNPALRYDYLEYGLLARQRITEDMWFGFGYELMDREDRYQGYNDFTRDSYGFEFHWSPGRRFDLELNGYYRQYDYPNAFAFHNPVAGEKTLETADAEMLMTFRLTPHFDIVAEVDYRENSSTDVRIAYDRTLYSLSVVWEL